jgi:hypothetical protein
MERSLEPLIAAAGVGLLEETVFGTQCPSLIDAQMTELALELGSAVDGWLWYQPSVACVAAAVLCDGQRVVVRAYQPIVQPEFLGGVIRVQAHLNESGFPAAKPLSGPLVKRWGIGRIESWLTDPGARRPHPVEMSTSAAGLATVVKLAAEVDSTGLGLHPMAPSTQLYPGPHSPIFDFAATSEGAEWIDAIAALAKASVDADTSVAVSHGDWSARNIRFGDHGIVAVYDWESLEKASEATAIGVAAATWRSLGEADDPISPGPDEIERYIDLYEHARQEPLTPTQRRSARGMAVYALAYTARCEHAIRPGRRDGRATARLNQDADNLMALLH